MCGSHMGGCGAPGGPHTLLLDGVCLHLHLSCSSSSSSSSSKSCGHSKEMNLLALWVPTQQSQQEGPGTA
jgi:hypothetical protein